MEQKKGLNRLVMVFVVPVSVVLFLFGASGCGGTGGEDGGANQIDTLIFSAYTVPKEAYQKEIIPAFQRYWKQKTGRAVVFYQSYMASGAQSRTIAAGSGADIAALSLEQDIQRLKEKGLITHDWKKKKYDGFVTRSVVVLAYRPGNPKQIHDWEDLTRPEVSVIYPSPRTSGGAMWIVNAIYGAGQMKSEKNTGKRDLSHAWELLKGIQRRVKVMDKSGRASVTTFENGFGDVLITYENEAILRKMQGKEFPYIVPEATILIENPIAVVDRNVEKHHTRDVAEAFVQFVTTPEAQKMFARYGFRPVDDVVLKDNESMYPVPSMLFDIQYLGGWSNVAESIYSPEGIWTRIIQELADEG